MRGTPQRRDPAGMSEMRYVLAASFDHVDDALAAYEQVNVAYTHVGTTLDFDAGLVVVYGPDMAVSR
jgi:hypothetical protein